MTTTNGLSTNADFAQSFVPGQKILNRYTLHRILGQGGMGVVWQARDEELDLDVALKFLPSIVVNDRSSLNDLKRETRRSLELTHPNIVRTYDFLQDNSLAGISMEYVDSDTLRNRKLDQPSGVFQPADLGEWSTQLCDALGYAHGTASIVHRDLKPANLLINKRNHLKIADFGISRSLVESVTQVTGNNSISGTLVYMSPQQLDGENTSPLDDVYSLGATLYELCTSRPPFYSGDIARQVHLKVPPLMRDRRAELNIPPGNLPQNWEDTVAACLAKDPLDRPQSAGEVAARLGLRESVSLGAATVGMAPPMFGREGATEAGRGFNTAAAQAPTAAVPVPHHLIPVPVTHRNNWVPMAVAAAAVIVLGLGGTIWFIASHKNQPTDHSGAARSSVADASQSAKPIDPAQAQKAAGAAEAARLANVRGIISVKSDPPGARLKVDDRPAEKKPALLTDLTLGQHSVKVMQDGYEDFATTVDVKENQPTSLDNVKLVRSTGWLSITSNPPGLDVVVTGPDAVPSKVRTPWNSDKLPVGSYEITATRPGWQPKPQTVSLARDQSLPVALDLSGGTVQIDSVPPKATVLVDGKPVGTTPYVLQNVEPGKVHYTLAATGYVNAAVDGEVENGKPANFNAVLVKTPTVAKAPAQPRQTVARTTTTRRRSKDGDDDDDNHHHDSSWKSDLIRSAIWHGPPSGIGP